MRAILKENKLRQLDVMGESQSLFLIKEKEKKDVDGEVHSSNIGINKVISNDVTIYMKEGEINNITYKGSPRSTTIPIQDISDEDRYLEGFIWREHERPLNKSDIIHD